MRFATRNSIRTLGCRKKPFERSMMTLATLIASFFLLQACMPFVCSRMKLATLNSICARIWNE